MSRRELPKVHSSSVYCIDIAFLLFFFFFLSEQRPLEMSVYVPAPVISLCLRGRYWSHALRMFSAVTCVIRVCFSFSDIAHGRPKNNFPFSSFYLISLGYVQTDGCLPDMKCISYSCMYSNGAEVAVASSLSSKQPCV